MARTVIVDFSAIQRLRARFARLEPEAIDANVSTLMVSWMKIITEDNRRGVLAGTDKYGVPMDPVKYRPVGRTRRTTASQRNVAKGRGGVYAGLGMFAAGLHNNLTSAEYRVLAGPPLAPRRASSRVITNLKTGYQRAYGGNFGSSWEAFGYWDEVVSTRGVPFLHAHFVGGARGRVRLPKRDLRGVRPAGMSLARKAALNWARNLTRAVQ